MFIGPCYILTNNGVSISTAITAIQLKPGVNGPCEILRASMTQGTNTTSSQTAAMLVRKSAGATVTTGVAGTTVNKENPVAPTTDASLGATATGITASAEGTNTEQSIKRGFNILNGWEWLPTPEERLIVPQSGFLGLTFMTAPASSTWYAEMSWRELRGG
jgi:hypothetical protein